MGQFHVLLPYEPVTLGASFCLEVCLSALPANCWIGHRINGERTTEWIELSGGQVDE
jgi:hypothetical protein